MTDSIDKLQRDLITNMENAVRALKIANQCFKRALDNIEKANKAKPKLTVVK